MQEHPIASSPLPAGYVEIGNPEQLGALYTALGTAQGSFGEIKRTQDVTVEMRSGGSYHYQYAPLEDLLAATRPALTANGLAVLTPIVGNGSIAHVVVILAHKDGARIMASFQFTPAPEIKDTAARITYLRRYGYSALLNLAADDDEDRSRSERPASRMRQAERPAQARNTPATPKSTPATPNNEQRPARTPPARPTAKPGELVVEESTDWKEHLAMMKIAEVLELAIVKSAASFRPGISLVQLQAYDLVLKQAIKDAAPETPSESGPISADDSVAMGEELGPYGGEAPASESQRDKVFDMAEAMGIETWTDQTSGEQVNITTVDWEEVTISDADRWIAYLETQWSLRTQREGVPS